MALAIGEVHNYTLRCADGGRKAFAAEPVGIAVSPRQRMIVADFPL